MRAAAAACLALLTPALPAQTPPGTEIVNVAVAETPILPAAQAPAVARVPSNRVTTIVAAGPCLTRLQLAVSPEGTVAPGAALDYTVTAINDSAVPLAGVVLVLRFAPGVASASGEGASWDPAAATLTWTLPALSPSATAVLRARAVVPADAPADGTLAAEVTATAAGCAADGLRASVSNPVVPPVLRAEKRADRTVALPGDAVGYTVVLRHEGTAPDLPQVALVDCLPAGFRYVPGSARVDGVPVDDPSVGGDGLTLTLPVGALAPGAERTVRLAALVGPGAPPGEAWNVARGEAVTAGGARLASPEATAGVKVEPGPFRPEATLAGRVFVDDDGDGLPGPFEPGVPGVLVALQDGRGAVTDLTGRWHLEAVRPGLHVARLDRATLPPSLVPREGGPEWGGDRGSRFVEARGATLVVADFPVGPPGAPRCTIDGGERLRLFVPAASLLAEDGAPGAAAAARLEEAAALLAGAGAPADPVVTCAADGPAARSAALLQARLRALLGGPGPPAAAGAPAPPEDPLREAVRTLPVGPAILSPADGARIGRSRVDVEVAYPAGTAPDLRVDGVPVPASRIGSTSTLPSRGLSASRYVGVELAPGPRRLEFRAVPPQVDPESVPATVILVTLPGPAAELRLSVPGERLVADGATPGAVVLELVDAGGVRSLEGPRATLEVEGASVAGTDADPQEDGFQVLMRDGRAEVRLAPLAVPGQVRLAARAGPLQAEALVPVVPGAGRWRLVGLAEGRAAGRAGVEGDGGLMEVPGVGITEDGGRLALFGRGPVGRSGRLTVALDTDRERDRDRLFGPADPEGAWPVTGDGSTASGEAERQGPLFARLDVPAGHVQWGDFATGLERTELGRYDRRMSGLSGQGAWGRFGVTAFAAPTDQAVARDVFEADGSSGPYVLSRTPVVVRSERVVVESRERDRTDAVVARQVKLPGLDYDLDPDSGALLFRGPVPAFDADLNPVQIVVVYETRAPGDAPVTAGGRAAFGAGTPVEVGVSAVTEGRTGEDLVLLGTDLSWRPRPGTLVRAETATSDEGAGSETAFRVEVSSRASPRLAWDARYRDVPAGFANPTLLAAPEVGRASASAHLLWTPAEPWRIRADALSEDDDRTGQSRRAAGVEAERRVGEGAAVMGGVRAVSGETPQTGSSSAVRAEAGVRGRLFRKLAAELRHAQAFGDEDVPGYPTRTQAGLTYDLPAGSTLFLRHEVEWGGTEDRDRTVLGVEGRIGARTRALARYALEDGADGAALRSTAGIETVLPLGPRQSVMLSASRLDTARGDGASDATTLAAGWEYRAGPSLLSARWEVRAGRDDTRHLLTAAGAFRPREAWALFARERLHRAAGAFRAEGRLGAAWRPRGGPWQMLVRADHALGSGMAALGTAGIGTEPPRELPGVARDGWSLALATGARPAPRQRMAASVIVRGVDADREAGIPSTLTSLVSVHYTADLGRLWTLGGSVRRFAQGASDTAAHGAGIEVGRLVARNLWLAGGWNVAGFSDGGFADAGRTERGPFVSLRFKFDEASLAQLSDLRLDR